MNKYEGDSLEDFLAEEGILEEVTERALKRLLVLEIEDMVKAANKNRTAFLEKPNTELVQLNHYLFDLDNTVITAELLNCLAHEAKEMKTHPIPLNDSLIASEKLLTPCASQFFERY